MPSTQPTRFDRSMPVLFVLIWSTGFIVARLGMAHAPPMHLLAWRFGLSALLLLGIAWLLGERLRVRWPATPMEWLHMIVSGLLMQALYLGGVWTAVRHGMSAGVSALIVGMQPLLTALAVSALGHRVRREQWLGLALGFAGLALVVRSKLGHAEFNVLSVIAVLLALAGITSGTLYQKYLVKPMSVWSGLGIQLAAAFVPCLLLASWEPQGMVWNTQVVVALAWGVLGLTAGASSLLYILIERGSAVNVTSLMYCVPPTAALMGWLAFDEHLDAWALGGMALVAVGVASVTRTKSA